MADTIQEQLVKYLSDAHSIEEQALQQLRSAPDIAGGPELVGIFREHLTETEGHERRVRERMDKLGESPSKLKNCSCASAGPGSSSSRRRSRTRPARARVLV
jgi:ferritin-like metal-binding protein YciE